MMICRNFRSSMWPLCYLLIYSDFSDVCHVWDSLGAKVDTFFGSLVDTRSRFGQGKNGRCFVCSFVSVCFVGFFMVRNSFKMVNLGFRAYCNILLDIFGTSQNRPNIDPHTPCNKNIRSMLTHI